jgi:hypothetical protein
MYFPNYEIEKWCNNDYKNALFYDIGYFVLPKYKNLTEKVEDFKM